MQSKKHACPVCGKHEFSHVGSFEICPVCGWHDDMIQEEYPDEDHCANYYSLNQAREAYARGEMCDSWRTKV